MRPRTTVAAAVAVLTLALAGCGSSGEDDKPEAPASSAPASATLDEAAARQACVDAWVTVLQSGSEEEPEPCKGLSGQRMDMYADALVKYNQANRDRLGECLDDPSCTSVPLP
jgi:uncharacterized protein YceK